MADEGDFFLAPRSDGRTMRGLTIQGLNKVRATLGMDLIPGPLGGEDPKDYIERIRSLRKETIEVFRTAPPDLGRLFGDDVDEVFLGKPPLKDVFFFREGQVAATDGNGLQVPSEQEPAWMTVLKDKIARGVVDDGTVIHLQYTGEELPLGELRRRHEF